MSDTSGAIDVDNNPYLVPQDWGTTPQLAQAPLPQPAPVTTQTPSGGQITITQGAPPQPAPAIQTGAPPTPGVSAPPALPFDDEQEFKIGLQNEASAFKNNKIDTLRGEPSYAPQLIDPQADERIKEINELRKLIPKASPKEQRQLITQLNATEGRIMREIKDKNTGLTSEANKLRADQLRSADAPFQDIEKRTKNASEISSIIAPMINRYTTGVDQNDVDPQTGKPRQFDMNNPAVKSSLNYTFQTSPLSTLKPVELRDVATNLALSNRNISNDMALRYVLAIGSPIELRKEWLDPTTGEMRQGDPNAPGVNGQKGKGGTNYKVLGHDPNRNMWVVQVGPQQLRIDDPTYQRLVQARIVGYNTARKVMADQAKAAADPTVWQRAAKPVEQNIIKPAEEFIQRFR